ncbi:MAG: hypothetical protein NVSMB62_26210 [Acidobacteriaceae bacterium]
MLPNSFRAAAAIFTLLSLASGAAAQSSTPAPSTTRADSVLPKTVELPPETPPAHRPYTQLFVFGDSYSDTGAGYVDGNGPTAVAYMAQHLGIPFTWYGAPDMKNKGINFAVSGGKTGAGEGHRYPGGELLSVGMINQVQEFADLLKAGTISFNPANTMFYLAGGLNDRKTPDGYTRTNLEQEIDTLYSLRARRFMVALLPVKIEAFDAVGIRLNPEITKIPEEVRTKHPDIRIALSAWGPAFDQVITHPAQYGLTDTDAPCAGRQLKDEDPDPCPHPETHFYYHAGHPSAAAHKAAGDLLFQEAITIAP